MANWKNCIRRILKTFILLTLLSFFVLFFLKDQITAFAKKRSTITSRFEQAKALQFPTLVLCLDPATKLTVSKKYGFEKAMDKFFKDVPNSTLYETFQEITYQLNKDYEISFHHGEKLDCGEMHLQEHLGDRKFLFDIQEHRTSAYGACVKIQPKFEVFYVPLRFVFTFSVNPKIHRLDHPKFLVMHITSNKTWINVVAQSFPQFQSQVQVIDFEKEFTYLYTRVVEKKYDTSVFNNFVCVKNLIMSTNCTNKCELLNYVDGLPICKLAKELKCIWSNVNMSMYSNCFKTRLATTYKLQQRIDAPLHKEVNRSSTTVYVGLWSMEKEIQEEVPLLTTQDFIGSIGGSLGMFFGFSFSATFFFCIDKVLK